ERTHPGDRPGRAPAQTISLSRALARSSRREQIRSHDQLRQSAANNPKPRCEGFTIARTAPDQSARDGGPVAREDFHPHRQRRIRTRKQIFWPNDNERSTCRSERRETAFSFSRKERARA